MAKRDLAFLFILSFLVKSSLAAEPITAKNWPKFAGIEWGSSTEVVTKALEKRGYECEKPKAGKSGKSILFTGMLAGEKAMGVCLFTQSKLEAIRIVYFEGKFDSDAATFGVKLTKILTKKYGQPLKFSKGIKEQFVWITADKPSYLPVVLEINPVKEISVNYSSLAYMRASEKRIEQDNKQDKKSQKDF
ncbi:hypothetical protein N9001_04765 [Akkermansiaceae bacterium]|nr:hypothetical protein [Akkermansiaceae bacterium]